MGVSIRCLAHTSPAGSGQVTCGGHAGLSAELPPTPVPLADAGSTIRRLFEVEGDAEGGEGADGDSFATGRHSRPASQGVSVWGDASAPPSQAQGPGSRHTSSTEEQAGPVASPRLPDAGGGGSWAAVLPGVAGEAFQCLAARKVALLAGDLQRLAFSAPQAVAAVRLFGSDLLGAVTWLLDAKMRGAADEAALLLAAAQRPPQDVDLAKETAAIEALVAAGVPEEEVRLGAGCASGRG